MSRPCSDPPSFVVLLNFTLFDTCFLCLVTKSSCNAQRNTTSMLTGACEAAVICSFLSVLVCRPLHLGPNEVLNGIVCRLLHLGPNDVLKLSEGEGMWQQYDMEGAPPPPTFAMAGAVCGDVFVTVGGLLSADGSVTQEGAGVATLALTPQVTSRSGLSDTNTPAGFHLSSAAWKRTKLVSYVLDLYFVRFEAIFVSQSLSASYIVYCTTSCLTLAHQH